jgi:N-acetylneuraminic acid mutarotase
LVTFSNGALSRPDSSDYGAARSPRRVASAIVRLHISNDEVELVVATSTSILTLGQTSLSFNGTPVTLFGGTCISSQYLTDRGAAEQQKFLTKHESVNYCNNNK